MTPLSCYRGHPIRLEQVAITDKRLPCGCPDVSAVARISAGLEPLPLQDPMTSEALQEILRALPPKTEVMRWRPETGDAVPLTLHSAKYGGPLLLQDELDAAPDVDPGETVGGDQA